MMREKKMRLPGREPPELGGARPASMIPREKMRILAHKSS